MVERAYALPSMTKLYLINLCAMRERALMFESGIIVCATCYRCDDAVPPAVAAAAAAAGCYTYSHYACQAFINAIPLVQVQRWYQSASMCRHAFIERHFTTNVTQDVVNSVCETRCDFCRKQVLICSIIADFSSIQA
jgi:hypothetical protein